MMSKLTHKTIMISTGAICSLAPKRHLSLEVKWAPSRPDISILPYLQGVVHRASGTPDDRRFVAGYRLNDFLKTSI
jgi:hypothetical protein